MDPNETLAKIRAITSQIIDCEVDPWDKDYIAGDLADVVAALDDWLTGGGFKPEAWS